MSVLIHLCHIAKQHPRDLAEALPNNVQASVPPVALTLPPIILEDVELYLTAPGYGVPVMVKSEAGFSLTAC